MTNAERLLRIILIALVCPLLLPLIIEEDKHEEKLARKGYLK